MPQEGHARGVVVGMFIAQQMHFADEEIGGSEWLTCKEPWSWRSWSA
jgi:hypothetical protein